MSGRPSMKFNSHPPNGVFIKAVTITASRRARPGYVLYKEGGDGGGGRETEGDCEKERGRVQCERGGGGLGQSAAGRQRGLICPKGSSASYAI